MCIRALQVVLSLSYRVPWLHSDEVLDLFYDDFTGKY